ncbi:hypothetical protein D3C86_1737880 [compost metagenome]
MDHTGRPARKTRIRSQVRVADGSAQRCPLRAGMGEQPNPALLCLVDAGGMRCAEPVDTQPRQGMPAILHHAGFHLHQRKRNLMDAQQITPAAVGSSQQGGGGA